MLEEPVFFGDREEKLNFNQIKLVLHRASMKYYQEQVLEPEFGQRRVKYFEYHQLETQNDYLKALKGIDELVIFDPVDHFLLAKIEKIRKKAKIDDQLTILPTPNFLTPAKDLLQYAKGKKKFFHHNFYNWQKKRMGVLKGIKSKDQENRSPPPKKIPKDFFPGLPPNPDLKTKHVKEAIKYVKKNFGKNYGRAEDFVYPICHQTSVKWFDHFLEKRFDKFGKYQDAIVQGEPWMFHSIITPMLNIGLLDPSELIDKLEKHYKAKKVAVNNYEGYLRQIIGWREYSRLLYLVAYKPIKNGNHFGHQRKLTSAWYTGKTGIVPIDQTIQMAFKYGYLHHILRLMMMGNFMNLCQLHPHEVYKWFMEFSVDSYDWVMTNNVYSMALFADGGLTMRKPYLTTSNYILKMSNYEEDGKWDVEWDNLYYWFLGNQKTKLRKTAMARNLGIWDRRSKKEKDQAKSSAQKTIRRITK